MRKTRMQFKGALFYLGTVFSVNILLIAINSYVQSETFLFIGIWFLSVLSFQRLRYMLTEKKIYHETICLFFDCNLCSNVPYLRVVYLSVLTMKK